MAQLIFEPLQHRRTDTASPLDGINAHSQNLNPPSAQPVDHISEDVTAILSDNTDHVAIAQHCNQVIVCERIEVATLVNADQVAVVSIDSPSDRQVVCRVHCSTFQNENVTDTFLPEVDGHITRTTLNDSDSR